MRNTGRPRSGRRDGRETTGNRTDKGRSTDRKNSTKSYRKSSDDRRSGSAGNSRFGSKPAFRKRDSDDERPSSRSRFSGSRDNDKGFSGSDRRGSKPAFRKRSGDRDERPSSRPRLRRDSEGSDRSAERPRFRRNDGDEKSFGRGSRAGSKPDFRKRDNEGEGSSERPRFRKSDDGERSFSRGRSGGDKPAFRRKTSEGEGSSDRPRFRKSNEGERSFSRGRGGEDKPAFRRRDSEGDSTDRPRFRSKRSDESGYTGRRSTADKAPFRKREEEDTRTPGQIKRASRSFSKNKAARTGGDDAPRKWNRKEDHQFYGDKMKRKTAAKETPKVDDGSIRLNKYIANAGICSSREADELIKAGVVSVNGEVVTEMGYKVQPTDIVKYNKETLRTEEMKYVLLNKPKDFITTTDDPEDRKTVMSLVYKACRERIYPVGRLDRNTTGILLFTNDGDLAGKLTHPKFQVQKVYQVELDRNLKQSDYDQIKDGIQLEDGFIKVDEIAYVGPDKSVVGVELHSGKNRIVRRIFESLGYEVKKLDRVIFAGLTKKDLPRGRWRFLTPLEVASLKMMTGKSV